MDDQKVSNENKSIELKEEYKVNVRGKEYKLLVTLGFWLKCGFKREEAEVITNDPEMYLKALKLAIYYGNKDDYGWDKIEDMKNLINDDILSELEQDYSEDLSLAMIHYLPIQIRKLVMAKMKEARDGISKVLDEQLDQGNTEEKKN